MKKINMFLPVSIRVHQLSLYEKTVETGCGKGDQELGCEEVVLNVCSLKIGHITAGKLP